LKRRGTVVPSLHTSAETDLFLPVTASTQKKRWQTNNQIISRNNNITATTDDLFATARHT